MRRSILYTLIVFCLVLSSCNSGEVFHELSTSRTGISFSNDITEDDQYNVYNYMNIYTGAGVAAGDINNDGLTDLYFSGNMVSGRIYLNKGGLEFEDITEKSGLTNTRWGTGVTMADVNQDGWMDIYVTVSGSDILEERANMLYINNGDNTFTEKAAQYGIADTRQSMHSAFVDYDRDGDLDLYVLVNPASFESLVNTAQPRKINGESESTDVLYRNNGDGTFTDVSREAGILIEGYGLGLAISDINNDQWPDIYISNDFIGNDILYINNGDGTFTDKISKHIKHTSYAGMGNDIADINNDGLMDIMVLDMRPNDNKRQKLIISSTGYDKFQQMLSAGYDQQYTRNTLQLNQGNGLFSEIGFMSGVSSTDWSWSPLFADYDNDGDRDLFVTNGFLRDLGNLDYIHYSSTFNNAMGDRNAKIQNKLNAISELESADLTDYVFENKGDAMFDDKSKAWGITDKSVSHGALFADLDNDGDLEIVVNTMNKPAKIYENRTNDKKELNFLKVKLNGPKGNVNGLGTKVVLIVSGKKQYHEHYTTRGFESSVDPIIHFGLGVANNVEKLAVTWPDGRAETIHDVGSNQQITVDYKNASVPDAEVIDQPLTTIFNDISGANGLDFKHREDDFVDFRNQPIIPHTLSKSGPGIAVADVNGDGMEDFYIGGASGQFGRLYTQTADNTFASRTITEMPDSEEMGLLFFDADNDGDQDLYIANGGTSFKPGDMAYRDKLMINDGAGSFREFALSSAYSSSSCVVAADYDRDGDLDLFIGGRVQPGAYPMTPRSFLLRNDSKNGIARFSDVTPDILSEIGMVTSALWTDYDNDGWVDLMVVGEFMPITFFNNRQGKIGSAELKIDQSNGWWNSLVGGDFDQDGDIDYLVGNLGLNSRFVANPEEPLCIYASDYDKNGKVDPVMCYFIDGENYLAHTRDDMIKQINAMRSRFKTYESYATASFEESFLPQELEKAHIVKCERMESTYLENLGDGKFDMKALPQETQMAPVFGMIADDYDGDGYLDILLVGNSYATEVSTGRYDASIGTFLKGNGDGTFVRQNVNKTGFLVDSDAKGLAILSRDEKQMVLVANNSDQLKAFERPQSSNQIKARPMDASALVTTKEGKTYKHEFYYGSTYLSHSSRVLNLQKGQNEIRIKDFKGNNRELDPTNLMEQ